MSAAWIIDESGEACEAGSARGLRIVQAAPSSISACVRITQDGHGDRILFDPVRVNHAALIGTLFWLRERAFRPTIVSYAMADMTRLFRTNRDLFVFLAGEAEGRAPRRGYSAIEIQNSPLADRLSAAKALCQSDVGQSDQRTLLHHLFGGLYVISRLDTACGDYRIEHMGDSLHTYDTDFVKAHYGRSFRESYDPEFGRWTADRFARMRSSTTVQVEKVDALIRWPGRPAARYRYHRLLVPYNVGDDAFLLTATHLT
jgi:hypothetical protein